MEAFSKETQSVWERYFGEDNEQSLKLEGKLKKFWKLSLRRKTRIFHDWIKSPVSCQVSRETQRSKKFEKFL